MSIDKHYNANGLTAELKEIFENVSHLKCINTLYLCGGTAQSIQISHRLSEDLDFELIGVRKERPELDFEKIINEVQEKFPNAKVDILGEDHFQIFVGENKCKLSFFRPQNPVKYIHQGLKYNNIVVPSLQDLLGMKLYTICVRTKTRDFYDIYWLLKSGCSLKEGISYASYLSRHSFKSKDMLAKLLSPKLYPINDEFLKLRPKEQVTSEQLKSFFQQSINNELSKSSQEKERKSVSLPFNTESRKLPKDFQKQIDIIGRCEEPIKLEDAVGCVQMVGNELRFQDCDSIKRVVKVNNLLDQGDDEVRGHTPSFAVDGNNGNAVYETQDEPERILDILSTGGGIWAKGEDGSRAYLVYSIEKQGLVVSKPYEEVKREAALKAVAENKKKLSESVGQKQTKTVKKGK